MKSRSCDKTHLVKGTDSHQLAVGLIRQTLIGSSPGSALFVSTRQCLLIYGCVTGIVPYERSAVERRIPQLNYWTVNPQKLRLDMTPVAHRLSGD